MTKNRSKHSGRAAEASRRAVAAQASTPKARPGVRPPVPATPTNKGEHAEGAARAIVSRGEASSMAQARRMVRQGFTSTNKQRRPR